MHVCATLQAGSAHDTHLEQLIVRLLGAEAVAQQIMQVWCHFPDSLWQAALHDIM